ncbi:hypothetical protein AVEN_5441-1 [Araneus ventricosus]|uniref:Uncharacterized protein n=1 Tax=Araneus ventricosus TaxID=182803 RepID=A0A4Y2PAH1_ARAVE|nr:hypothetical protein AVEN_5441-1 [Araneus ventricosus]
MGGSFLPLSVQCIGDKLMQIWTTIAEAIQNHNENNANVERAPKSSRCVIVEPSLLTFWPSSALTICVRNRNDSRHSKDLFYFEKHELKSVILDYKKKKLKTRIKSKIFFKIIMVLDLILLIKYAAMTIGIDEYKPNYEKKSR